MNPITTNHVILTLAEAARFLRVKKAALQKLVDEGRVPARKIGAEWRFFRGALDDPTLMPMLEEIYKARGRPMVEYGDAK